MRTFLLLFVFFSPGCIEVKHTPPKNNPLYDEVIAVHDKVMPEIATIHAYKRDLKTLSNEKNKDLIFETIKSLEAADEAMMSWMAEFKVPEDKTQETGYLQTEKSKISEISDQMYSAMAEAKMLLDSLSLDKQKSK